jgi:Co/Zn/Cd efflux system component
LNLRTAGNWLYLMNDGCCEGDIDVTALERSQRRVLVVVLGINVATFLIMVVGAVLSGSSSLLSGTLDNLGDAVTYALSLAVVGSSVAVKARVAFLKGLLILGAAFAVAVQVVWRLSNMETPVFESMGIAALLNLGANLICLRLLFPLRNDDLNMTSMWECSRNDIADGLAVIAATAGVWLFDSGWPDVLIAIVLLVVFLRSATRVLGRAWREWHGTATPR